MKDVRKLQYKITSQYAGITVLSFLKQHGFSSRVITTLKQNPYGIMIGNKKVTVQKQLKTGNLLTIRLSDKRKKVNTISPCHLPIQIVYEDEDVIVCNKPHGLATHPTYNYPDDTLANALAFYFKEHNIHSVVRPVNRLDKDTSGLILFAKNAHASTILSAALKKKQIRRSYLAIVSGLPRPSIGTIDAPISRLSNSTLQRVVDLEKGARAVTDYKVLKTDGVYSLVTLQLHTGRTHQIRVHMSYIGHAVVGDWLYNDVKTEQISRQALHSHTLAFTHPITCKALKFTAELPPDISALTSKMIDYHEEEINEASCI